MKKFLLLVLLSATAGINAQTLFEENFNTLPATPAPFALPTGWTTLNISEPLGTQGWFTGSPGSFAAFEGPENGYIAVNWRSGAGVSTLNNWLMTPPVIVQNGDRVSFYARTPTNSTWADRIELRMSSLGATSTNPSGLTNVGSYTTLCLTINPDLVGTGFPQVWTKYTYTVAGVTGQSARRFALRYTVTDGGSGNNSNYVGVDAFQVLRPLMNDLLLNSVAVPAILSAGNFSFVGQVTNQGTNVVTAYQVRWQSNGGVQNTSNITGVNIAVGASHTFTHTVPLNAVVGQTYALNFDVSTVNGVTDDNTTNNALTRNTQVPSGSTTYKPMIEKFTGSTCPPCASYNNATFNPFYAAQNQNFNYVAYHMNFPGLGDPYFIAEARLRFDYYGLGGITAMVIDGANYSTGNNQATLTTHINSQATKAAYFSLTASRNLIGNNAVVNYTVTPLLSGNFVLHAAVIEKTTTGNVGTNGETQFKHVMMKMVPNANGTPLTMTAGTPVSGTVTASLAGSFIEEIADCEVVLFIQNPITKEIMQSFTALDVLSTPTNLANQTVKLYPNPSSDFVRISNVEVVDVQITDLTGKTVVSLKNVTNQTDINVSALNTGMYLFTVSNETINQTIKFVKK